MADLEEFIKKWDEDIENIEIDKKELYERLLEKFNETGEKDSELCWRLVRSLITLADACENLKQKSEARKYIEKSFEYAKKALELNPDSMQVHKWYCAAVGRMAPYVSTKERIQFGHTFKEHRDIAVKMDSNDCLMHHMYGRWCYEVASLSFIERKIAATFFADPPTANYNDSLESLKKANELKPDWKMNHLWLAKALIALKNYPEAMEHIEAGLAISSTREEDVVSQNELEQMEKSYRKYKK